MHEELIKRLQQCQKALATDGYSKTGLYGETIADAISALTASQAEMCEHKVWLFGIADVDICAACGIRRPWTRKDGSTTPRGDVVDRRKSDKGYQARSYGSPLSGHRGGATYYGRRSADRSRWVQETPQTLSEWQYDFEHHNSYGDLSIALTNRAETGWDLMQVMDRARDGAGACTTFWKRPLDRRSVK